MDPTAKSADRVRRRSSHGGAPGRPGLSPVTALEASFRTLAHSVPGLAVDVVGRVAGARELVHPTAGFEVRLRRGAGQYGVSLYVSARYSELTSWRGPGQPGPSGALRERFQVDLESGFRWGDTDFRSAEALAQALLGYMQFQLDALDPAGR
jgi:hypothetical protein